MILVDDISNAQLKQLIVDLHWIRIVILVKTFVEIPLLRRYHLPSVLTETNEKSRKKRFIASKRQTSAVPNFLFAQVLPSISKYEDSRAHCLSTARYFNSI